MASKSLGTLTVDLIAKIGGFKSGMTEAEKASAKAARKIEKEQKEMAKKLDETYRKIGANLKAAFTIGFAGASAVVGAGMANLLSQMDKAKNIPVFAGLAQMGVEEFQKMALAAETVNIPTEKLSDVLKDVNEKIGEFAQTGGGGFKDFFEQVAPFIGLTADELQRMSGRDALLAMVSGMEKAGMTTKEMSFFLESVGSDLTNLLPLLRDNGAELLRLEERASDAGAIMSSDFIESAKVAQEELNFMKMQVEGLRTELAEAFIPVLIETLNQLTPMIKEITEWAKSTEGANTITEIATGSLNTIKGVIGLAEIAWGRFNAEVGAAINYMAGAVEQIGILITGVINFGKAVASLDLGGVIDSVVDGARESMRNFNTTLEVAAQESAAANARMASGSRKVQEALNGQVEVTRRAKQEVKNYSDTTLNGYNAMTGAGNDYLSALSGQTKQEVKTYNQRREAHQKWLKERQEAEESLKKSGRGGGKSGGGASKREEKSEEEKSLERAMQSYESIKQSMHERMWMLGKEGEAAKVAYESEFGSLKLLDQAKKDSLLLDAQLLDQKEAQFKRDEEARQQRDSDMEYAKQVIADMEHELLLLGKTSEEQEKLNMLRRLGNNIDTETKEKAEATLAQLQATEEQVKRQEQLVNGFKNSFANAFESIIDGSMSAKDAFKSMIDDMLKQIMRMIINQWTDKLFAGLQGMGGGAGGGGFWANLFGGLVGGGKAAGGAVQANTMYRVNEVGPEMLTIKGKDFLMMGGDSGRVTPNHLLRGGGGVSQNNNFIIHGKIDRRTEMQIAQRVGQKAQQAQNRNH